MAGNGIANRAWPAGSIPRTVKKLSWDDESDSPQSNKVHQKQKLTNLKKYHFLNKHNLKSIFFFSD
jgi:hypothetical protein